MEAVSRKVLRCSPRAICGRRCWQRPERNREDDGEKEKKAAACFIATLWQKGINRVIQSTCNFSWYISCLLLYIFYYSFLVLIRVFALSFLNYRSNKSLFQVVQVRKEIAICFRRNDLPEILDTALG